MKFLVLGAAGMAGHTISIYLKERKHEVEGFDREKVTHCDSYAGDARNLDNLRNIIMNNGYDVIINCIGILNQFAEQNKELAVFLNAYLPHYLAGLTKEMKTKIIQMSTDCVFSGKKGNYNEDSLKDGETFYDRTKALGEIDNDKDLTFRNSIIGPDMKENGIGLFNWFMKQTGNVGGYTKAMWTGVTTLTLAKAMERAAKQKLTGLYNLVNNEKISKYEMLKLFNKHFKENKLKIEKNDTVVLDKSLINNRKDFDFEVPGYEEMIVEMKEWINSHKELYKHYFSNGRKA